MEVSGLFFSSLNLSMADNTFGFKSEMADNPLLSSSGLSPSELIESLSRAKVMPFSDTILNHVNKIFNNL